MAENRRDFLKLTSAATGALALGILPGVTTAEKKQPSALRLRSGQALRQGSGQARRPLRLLILGGTSFIGPPQVRYAQSRGHKVTLFNRGQTNPGMFADVEQLRGDRSGDLESLKGKTWDVVIDNSASDPKWVRLTAQLLKGSVDRYFYVSSRSAYSDTSRIPMTREAPVFTFETARIRSGQTNLPYGLRKALSEKEAQEAFGTRAMIVRPGLIIGPGDDTDRFTYWPVRISRGGEVLAPGDPSDPVQIIDARDLSEWMVRMAENGTTGVFNGVGPATPRPMAELLYGIRAVTTAETTFTWVSTDFLTAQKVRPYSDLPVWMPPRDGREGFARFDITPEVKAGLTFRPLAVTTRETLDFHLSRPPERQAKLEAGISGEREKAVLAVWHARKGSGL